MDPKVFNGAGIYFTDSPVYDASRKFKINLTILFYCVTAKIYVRELLYRVESLMRPEIFMFAGELRLRPKTFIFLDILKF